MPGRTKRKVVQQNASWIIVFISYFDFLAAEACEHFTFTSSPSSSSSSSSLSSSSGVVFPFALVALPFF
jgi:hypothetical protein